ncbi:MAG: hypothetical protein ACYC6Y_05060 [Thermoguttaceae bacterium]
MQTPENMADPKQVNRRTAMGRCVAAAGSVCALGKAIEAAAAESQPRAAALQPPAPAQPPSGQPAATDGMLYGKLGEARFSRLMLGGNLVSGYMHSRDLKYVNRLFRAYVTDEKIFETFRLAEENGINTVLESGANLVYQYNKERGGKMQIIPSIHPEVGLPAGKLKAEIAQRVDEGCPALYVWGVACDKLTQLQRVDLIGEAVELTKQQGVPIGVGCHSLQVVNACEEQGIPCDFYVKTLHQDNYFTATPKPLRKEYIWLGGGEGWEDSMWCINPEETVQYMATVKKPWVAFKVLAAGAILPRTGFAHALDSGADFLGVGMFDFQIAENCETFNRLARRAQQRSRPWYG